MLSRIRSFPGKLEKGSLPERSIQSLAFEAMWRELPREGLVPSRSAFRPERAARMLPHLVLLQVMLEPVVTARLRLIGGALRDLVGCNVTGIDYLTTVPDPEYQSAYLAACMRHPCASWAASPIEYERGYTGLFEITSFPLIDPRTGQHFALAYLQEIGSGEPGFKSVGGPFEVKPAIVRRYIDIGGGVPA